MDNEKTTPESQNTGTADLNRTLGRMDLFSMACGQIIGAGIMALLPSAIGLTGRSVNLAFLLAAVFTIMIAIPQVILGGTLRLRGGNYTTLAALMSPKVAGAYMVTYLVSNLSISSYAVSFASYFLGIFPLGIDSRIIAFICFTLFLLLNLRGIAGAAFIQNAMTILLFASLAAFVAFGIGKVNWTGAFGGTEDWMTGGISQFMYSAVMLTYATGGATVVINFGAEAKNPTKDIPIVVVSSTCAIAILYAVMATIAAGTIPLDQVGDSLVSVAKTILPTGIYYLFICGGAWMALTTTLNATYGWVTKPLLQACADGWFPKSLAKVHPKYKTPTILLLYFYVLGLIPLLTGMSVSNITTLSQVLGYAFSALMSIAVINIPKKVPEIWEKSRMKCSNGLLYFIGCLGACSSIAQFIILASNKPLWVWIGNFGLLAVSFIYSYFREKSGAVNMEISYEAA